jgi:hypothetical protein
VPRVGHLIVTVQSADEQYMNILCIMKHGGSILDSGDYRKKFCMIDIQSLPEGDFWLIPSCFQKGDVGKFYITVESNVNFTLAAE